MKIRIAAEGWAGYTGFLSTVEFVDGESVGDVPQIHINRLGSIMSITDLDGNPVGPGQRILDTRSFPIAADMNAAAEGAVTGALAPKFWKREDLEAIADKSGIAGVREVSDKMGIKSNSVSKLIAAILQAQAGAGAEGSEPVMLVGSSVQPAVFEVDGKQVQLGTVVADAQRASGLTVDEWNDLPGENREGHIQKAVERLKAL